MAKTSKKKAESKAAKARAKAKLDEIQRAKELKAAIKGDPDALREYIRKASKKINQRLVRAERSGVTDLDEYKALTQTLHTSGMSTRSKKRFQESVKNITDIKELKRRFRIIAKAEGFDISRQTTKWKETERRFKTGRFKERIKDIPEAEQKKFIKSFLKIKSELAWQELLKYLSSDQIFDIVKRLYKQGIEPDEFIVRYFAAHRGQEFNESNLMNAVRKGDPEYGGTEITSKELKEYKKQRRDVMKEKKAEEDRKKAQSIVKTAMNKAKEVIQKGFGVIKGVLK